MCMKTRYVLKNRLRFAVFIMVVTAVIVTLLFAVSAQGYGEPVRRTVTVSRGDSLWRIALKNKKRGDTRKYIYEIKRLNNLKSSDIYPGDELLLPADN